MDLADLIAQKRVALSAEDHHHMHVLVMLKGRPSAGLHLKIPELHRQIPSFSKSTCFVTWRNTS